MRDMHDMSNVHGVHDTERKLTLSVANSRKSWNWKRVEMSWEQFCSQAISTKRTVETVEEYGKMPKGQRDDIKDVGGFVFGTLSGGRRKKSAVLSRTGITLDMDYGTPDFAADELAKCLTSLYGCRAVIYSTHKHTPEAPRLRLVIPLSRAVGPEEYAAAARKVAEDIGINLFDDTTYEAHRMMYWPSTSSDGEFSFRVLDGVGRDAYLDPDTILSRYADWRDVSSWPVSERQQKLTARELKKQSDPLGKQGLVGAFCRTYYPITDAVSEFLPDIYEPCQRDGLEERYDYIPADSSAGVVIYDGKYLYSHHASDPACGMLLNAFDLVRIHKFGELDEGRRAGGKAGRAGSGADMDDPANFPSYKKMLEFVSGLPEVRELLAKERMAKINEDFSEIDDGSAESHPATPVSPVSPASPASPASSFPPVRRDGVDATDADDYANTRSVEPDDQDTRDDHEADTEWQKSLDTAKNGAVKDTLDNISQIIRCDRLLLPIAYNRHRDGIDVSLSVGKIPWKQVKPGWNDSDHAALLLYLSKYYGLYAPSKTRTALQAVTAERAYHPIKIYLEGLPAWDGTHRVDTILIDYLGAEDTPYTRAVTRKTLAAAVARIYEPGIKFDHVLILSGPQGIGKSTLFAKLAGKWFSDSLSMTDMKDKSGPEKLQGYWILELGELAGMKKTEVETVKSFISRTDDKYRASYGVNVEAHPRQCIIVGSTNSENGFLRDVTGNRRFWPVDVDGHGKYKTWELDEKLVGLIWAEVLTFYRDETLYLTGKEAEMAVGKQEAAMEADEREGLVRQYLETPLPTDWSTRQVWQRRNFLNKCGEGEFQLAGEQGTVRRMTVTNIEIWTECLGKDPATMKKQDSYDISSIMNRIGGWKRTKDRETIPLYGRQRVYRRDE